MIRNLLYCAVLALASPVAISADTASPAAKLSAAEIVARNVSARGGVEAWRSVRPCRSRGKWRPEEAKRTPAVCAGHEETA